MSEQLNEKRNEAIRLFGAMSGVEEEYLAACEDYKKAKPKGVIVFMQKYGKGMAAVLCLAVLGAGFVSMQQVANSDKAAVDMDFAMNAATASQECAEEPRAEAEMEESLREELMTDGAISNSAVSGTASENKEISAEPEMPNPESIMQESSVPAKDYVDENGRGDDLKGIEEEMTLEAAKELAVVGEYVPDSWPEDGVFVDVSGVRETGAESVKILWMDNDMQEVFVVKVENIGKDLPEWVQEGIRQDCVVQRDEFSKEFIVMNGKASSGNADIVETDIGVLHENSSNYVLVRFMGKGTVEQIWELLQ